MSLHRREKLDGWNLSKLVAFEVELQIPRSLCAQTAAEDAVWEHQDEAGTDLSRVGSAEGMSDRRRTLVFGSRAYVHRDTTEACGGLGDRIPQGEERYRDRPGVRWT